MEMVMENDITKLSKTFKLYSEEDALARIREYKDNQMEGGYVLSSYKNDYKCKKDRKTGDIVDEYWLVTVNMKMEIE